MRKSGCNRRKPRVRAKPRNGAISRFQRFLKMGASTADCIWQIVESIRELMIISHDEIAPVRSKGGSFSQPGHKLWVSRRTFLLMVQAFWLVRLTWHSRSHEIAIGYIEEMERQYTSSIAARRFFSIHPSESVGYCGRYLVSGNPERKSFSYNKRTMDRAMGPF